MRITCRTSQSVKSMHAHAQLVGTSGIVLDRLTAADLAEIDTAVKRVQALGLSLEDVGQADFPLPALGPILQQLHKDLLYGRGFRVLRGLPVPPAVPLEYASFPTITFTSCVSQRADKCS